MVRTQVQLPEKEYEQLREIAARERRSIADCIREGVRWVLQRARAESDDLSSFAGKFQPGSMKALKPHDRWNAEAIRESKTKSRRK